MPAEQQEPITGEATESVDNAYQRLQHAIHNDPRWLSDVNLGKRVGFYRFRGDLGSGNFSQVKMAVHQLTREAVAVKILDKAKLDAKTRKMLAREISTMEAIHHPNIIRLYEVVETYSKIHLVLEYASGGELFNRITTSGKLSEDEARPLFAQVVSAVNYMHEHGFIHRDIKAENVFYSGAGLVKLGDFGFSTKLASGMSEQLKTFCGSPPYAAPELFRDDSYLGSPVDAWALGVLLYFLVTAQMPFRALTVAALKQAVLLGQYIKPAHVSQACVDLIGSILQQAPCARLSVDAMARSDWLADAPLASQPGAWEKFMLTPSLLPRKSSEATVNGDVAADDSPEGVASEYRGLGLAELEIRAREKLAALGVTADMLHEHAGLGAKSYIVGAYRMTIHRLQKADSCLEEALLSDDAGVGQSQSGNNNTSRRKSKSATYQSKSGGKVLQRHRSKTCAIV